MTAIALQPAFDPIAELRAILADWVAGPVESPKPAKVELAKRKSTARDFGMGRVSYRKTPCGFLEPVVTMPKTCESGKVASLAEYHARLIKMGCEPVGTCEQTGATIYRTPERTELKVRSLGEGTTLEKASSIPIVAEIKAKMKELEELRDYPVTAPMEYIEQTSAKIAVVEAELENARAKLSP